MQSQSLGDGVAEPQQGIGGLKQSAAKRGCTRSQQCVKDDLDVVIVR